MQPIMKVLICDSSAMAELLVDPLLETALQWKVKLAVPDVLYERDLRSEGAERFRRLGLRVESLAPAGLARALELRKLDPRLSFTDSCALVLAATRSWLLLSQNPTLGRIAAESAVEFRDVAWLRAETMRLEALPVHLLAARRRSAVGDACPLYEELEHSSV